MSKRTAIFVVGLGIAAAAAVVALLFIRDGASRWVALLPMAAVSPVLVLMAQISAR
jgi:hypothetical protein